MQVIMVFIIFVLIILITIIVYMNYFYTTPEPSPPSPPAPQKFQSFVQRLRGTLFPDRNKLSVISPLNELSLLGWELGSEMCNCLKI